MKVPCRILLALSLPLSLGLGNQAPVAHNFDEAPIGASPPGFTFGSMRQKAPGRWTVQKRDADVFLYHERDALTGFSLAIADTKTTGDLAVTMRLRFVDGARAGGLVWRYVDDNHYYTLILDMAKGEIAVYRVSNGHRVLLEVEDDLELDSDAWHTLKVVHTDESVRAMLGGVRVFEDRDRTNRWSGGATRVGLIATGNSGVEFDDLRIAVLTTKPEGR
jgi:hypothetical protein